MSDSPHFIKTRRFMIWGSIDKHIAKNCIERMREWADLSQSPIYLYINSDGGSTSASDAIIDEICGAITRGINVYTIVQGEACSAAADILAMGQKECRFATQNSAIMLHPISYDLPVDYQEQQQKAVDFFKKRTQLFTKVISKACGKRLEHFTKDIDKGLWLTAREAVKYGVVDGIWDFREEKAITEAEQEETVV